jgi:hypothetical protein
MTARALPDAAEVLAGLWRDGGLPAQALERVRLHGTEPVLPSSFALGTALASGVAAVALAAVEVGRLRGGAAQTVEVGLLDAALESACHFTLDGRTPAMWDKLSGLYPCGGAAGAAPGHVRLHANFAHHRDGALALLGLSPGALTERAAVADALRHWPAEAFESAAAARGLVAAAMRTPEQWRAHPQAAAVAALPRVDIERIADAPPRALPPIAPHAPPLQGLRVLELTRILAGPVAGRTLAAHGADVLLLNSPRLPNIEALAETSRGKLSAHVDLDSEGRPRHAARTGPWRRHLPPGLPARQPGPARLLGGAAGQPRAGHRLRVAFGLRACRPLARSQGLRLPGADRHRLERRRSRGAGRRAAARAAGAGLGLRRRLPSRLRRPGGALAAGA